MAPAGDEPQIYPGGPHKWLSTIDAVWLIVCVAYPFVVLNLSLLQVDDGDLWWTLALGRAAWQAGTLPTVDPLAYTAASAAYIQGQWLANLIFYGSYLLGGMDLLVILRAAIVAVVFGLLYSGCRRIGAAPALAGLCTILSLPLINVGLALRPQILALVPFMLYLEGTRWPRRTRRALYLLPLAMIFWANVHGSFLLGLGLLGIVIFARLLELVRAGKYDAVPKDADLRRLTIVAGLSTIAPLLNPHGLGALAYLRSLLTVAPGHRELGGLLTEWLPTSLDLPGGPPFFVSLLVLTVAICLNVRYRSPPEHHARLWANGEVIRLLLFCWLAIRWIRMIVWWGLVLPAPLAGLLQRAIVGRPSGPPRPGRPRTNVAFLSLVALACIASLPGWRQVVPGLAPDERSVLQPSPVEAAVAYVLPEAEAGRLFHFIAWGGYLSWRLVPEHRIFVDGRYEAYPPAVFDDYAHISRGEEGWDTRLDRYGVGQLLLSRSSQSGLVAAVERATVWQQVYFEGDVVLYRRVPS
jgi:hypothetical protein